MPLTETETCMRLITPALEAAGWDIQTQIRREYTFTDGRLTVRGRISHRGTPSRADYVLVRGDIALAVVEAKKEGDAKKQAENERRKSARSSRKS